MASGGAEMIINSPKKCCNADHISNISCRGVVEAKATENHNCSSKTQCSRVILKPAGEGAAGTIREFVEKTCCSTNAAAELPASQLSDFSTRTCYAVGACTPTAVEGLLEQDDCSGNACCGHDDADADADAADRESFNTGASGATTTSQARIDNMDIEKGLFPSEHIVLSIQGMTCSGCEKKLYRSLKSLSAVSNIKTSLVLAQAEFDLCGSIPGDSITTVIERMTGFVCMKLVQGRSHLDVTVACDAYGLARNENRPLGVADLIALNKTTVRVIYDPKSVGARDLVSDPFFPNATLAPIAPSSIITSGRAHVHQVLFMTLLSTLLTIPILIMSWAPLPKHEILYGAISLGLATIVQTVVAGPFYGKAVKALVFSRMIEMDLLIVLSTSIAFVYSVIAYGYLVAGTPLSTGQFFETSTLLVTLIMVGRYVSVWARQKAVESISTRSFQNPAALLVDLKSHQELEIDARLLQYQDVFMVLPETSIVTDGIVISGETEVDESLITGEAELITKKPGMSVIAGSINHSGTLTVALTHLPYENTIQSIENLVDEAKSSKPPVQEIADRVAAIFVPAILAITVLTYIIWVAVGVTHQQKSIADASVIAMTYAISALIVSCPCAIGLAVPMVVAIAGGIAAKHGLILKSSSAIEIARKVSHVVFDKTGTLTQGKLVVVAECYPTGRSDILAPVIAGLAANSKHPVSVAIVAHIEALGVQVLPFSDAKSVVGSGIEATWNGKIIRAGSSHWLGVDRLPFIHQYLSQGLTTFCVTIDGSLVAAFGLKDSLRHDAIEVIDQLKRRSVKISIVSGDNEEAVRSIARLLGIPQSHVRFRCTPSDKQQYVAEMLKGEENTVMFCGDGTNDAGALAQASIGMHVNGGTDIAQNAADVVLMHSSLSGILVLVDLSKAFYRRVISNFLWSFAYNAIAILLAAGAFPNARIPPEYAGLGEVVSVLPVIAIAMLLRSFRSKWGKQNLN